MEKINIGIVAHDKATQPIKNVQKQVSQFRVVVDNSTKSTANFNRSMQTGARSSGMMRGGIQQLVSRRRTLQSNWVLALTRHKCLHSKVHKSCQCLVLVVQSWVLLSPS